MTKPQMPLTKMAQSRFHGHENLECINRVDAATSWMLHSVHPAYQTASQQTFNMKEPNAEFVRH